MATRATSYRVYIYILVGVAAATVQADTTFKEKGYAEVAHKSCYKAMVTAYEKATHMAEWAALDHCKIPGKTELYRHTISDNCECLGTTAARCSVEGEYSCGPSDEVPVTDNCNSWPYYGCPM